MSNQVENMGDGLGKGANLLRVILRQIEQEFQRLGEG